MFFPQVHTVPSILSPATKLIPFTTFALSFSSSTSTIVYATLFPIVAFIFFFKITKAVYFTVESKVSNSSFRLSNCACV